MANPMLLRGLVRDFNYWLPKGKADFKEGIERYQEKLRDEKTIDRLKKTGCAGLAAGLVGSGFLQGLYKQDS